MKKNKDIKHCNREHQATFFSQNLGKKSGNFFQNPRDVQRKRSRSENTSFFNDVHGISSSGPLSLTRNRSSELSNKLQLQNISEEEFQLAQQRNDFHRVVGHWYDRYQDNLQTNSQRASRANSRLIEFEEGVVNELRLTGHTTGRVVSMFGGHAKVVGLCIRVLTEVGAAAISGRSGKIAASTTLLEKKYEEARESLEIIRHDLENRIDGMNSAFDYRGWGNIKNIIANRGVPEVVEENLVYRDLLLAFAREGGYSISGSQWNVENRSPFGDSDWYHTYDWGSPGWTNGQDIASELNSLAEADPNTKIDVDINGPL